MRRVWAAVLRLFGVDRSDPVSEVVRRVDAMERKARDMEYVTMTWTSADLSEDEQRAAGLIP